MPYHPQTTSRQMVSRILQRNYVRKWLIRYYKPLENSGYIRCYKGWVFWATINRSMQRYLTSCHRTWWIKIVLAGNHQSINRRVSREFCERTSTLQLIFLYQTYATYIPVVFASVFCYFVSQVDLVLLLFYIFNLFVFLYKLLENSLVAPNYILWTSRERRAFWWNRKRFS